MKITLYLVFTIPGLLRRERILKKSWEVISPGCPFWSMVYPGGSPSGGFKQNPFGILKFPHTGDTHTIYPSSEKKHSTHRVVIKSKQTNTSEISIWSEVKEVILNQTDVVLLGDPQDVIEEFQQSGWGKATEEECASWRIVTGKRLPPNHPGSGI